MLAIPAASNKLPTNEKTTAPQIALLACRFEASW